MGDILIISSTGWSEETHLGTQHQLARQLARHHQVFFVELPPSFLSGFTGLQPGALRKGLGRWLSGRLRQIEGVRIISPPPVLPLRYRWFTGACNQLMLAAYLRWRMKREGVVKPLVVTFQADSAALIKRLPAGQRVYWCTDDWAAAERWWQPAKLVRQRETRLLAVCDQVIAVSRKLCQRFAVGGKEAVFIPNGVDLEQFDVEGNAKVPTTCEQPGRPVVGFAGIMSNRSFDAPLLGKVVKRRRDWTFLIVGRPEGEVPGLEQLLKEPNVTFAGYQPPTELAAWVNSMDVCLIPWTVNEWVASAFPLKLFEYLAMGKPVVARESDVYEAYRQTDGMVYTWQDDRSLEVALSAALAKDTVQLRELRVALARQNGWEQRAAALLALVGAF